MTVRLREHARQARLAALDAACAVDDWRDEPQQRVEAITAALRASVEAARAAITGVQAMEAAHSPQEAVGIAAMVAEAAESAERAWQDVLRMEEER